VQFENWLKDNPESPLPGWIPSANKPHQEAEQLPPIVVIPPGKEMTPEARETLAITEMENSAKARNSPGAKFGRKAGGLIMMLAVGNIAGAVIIKAFGLTSSFSGLIIGGIDAVVLTPLAIGTYAGKKKWGFWAVGYFTLSTILSLIIPGKEPIGSDFDVQGISQASTAIFNGLVIFSLYWFVKRMDDTPKGQSGT